MDSYKKNLKYIFASFNIILGSSSTSRKSLLTSLLKTTSFISCSPSINESQYLTKEPEESALLIANAKADTCLDNILSGKMIYSIIKEKESNSINYVNNFEEISNIEFLKDYFKKNPFFLISSDQIAYYKSQIRQKPKTFEEAENNIKEYSAFDDPIETITAIVVINSITKERIQKIEKAKIWFKKIPDIEIKKIVQDGKIFSSAGGFLIDDQIMSLYLDKIDGSVDSVLGLPLKLLSEMLIELFEKIHGNQEEYLNIFKQRHFINKS